MTNKELWPFKPVYDELKIRLAGIEDECEPLGLEVDLRNETEEEMFIALTTQKAFAFDVTDLKETTFISPNNGDIINGFTCSDTDYARKGRHAMHAFPLVSRKLSDE